MPTGYTSDLTLDTSFRDFAMRCSRAMGAMILMRDDPLDAPIPDEFQPSDYHLKAIDDARSKLAAVSEMSITDAQADLEKHNAAMLKSRKESRDRDVKQRAIYERMIAQVETWTPPTADHVNFKTFMLDQLRESFRFDCHDDKADSYDYYKSFDGTADQWREELRSKASRDVSYHAAEWEKEQQRTRERNEWVRNLKQSLKPK